MSDLPDAPLPIRVLHLEDSHRDAEIIRDLLDASGPAYDVVQVDSRSAFEFALAEGGFAAVICDFNLPDLDGLTALTLATDRLPDVPVIIVSGAIDPVEAAQCLREGATDYVLKDRLERLPSAVTRAIEEAELRRERRQLDAKLRESEERFRQLAEQSSDGFWFIGLNPERILYVSPAAERIWGLSAEEFYRDSRVWLRVVHADDQAHMREVRKARAKGGDQRFEAACRVVRSDGSARWVLNSGTAIRNEAGAITGLSGLTQDITERKQAEEALRQSEAFSRTVLNSLSYHIAVVDAQGMIVAANQAWEVFAIANGANHITIHPVGANYLSVVEESIRRGDASAQAALEGIRAVLRREREVFVLEYPCHSPDKRRWFVMRVCPRSDGGGAVVAHQDITARTELETQFRQAQKIESVGRLAGGIAHDFNNLLTVINGIAELALAEVNEGDPLRADLGEIRTAGERAAALTRQLLAFSRTQILQPRVLSLAEVVASMEKMLRRLIGEDIDFVVRRAENVGNTRADPGQLEQVLVNLVVNARDAMPNGGTLTIETRNVDLDDTDDASMEIAVSPGPYVMLAVSDTGVGIDDLKRRRLFEPFYTTKGPDKGTGLGLSTVHGIIAQSGGGISLHSALGQGTRFEIYLPRVADAAGEDPPRQTPASTGGTETILLVEDNGGLRMLARRILVSAGYTVLAAANGEEALLALERHEQPVHLLLTDVVMPGMNGHELALRSREMCPGMKVLYVSGYTDDAIVRYGILDQTMSFVSKPFTAAELIREVRKVLGP